LEEAVRSALVIVTCLIAAACSATAPAPRALESGFATGSGVADPYEDGKGHLAAGRYGLAAQRFGQALANDRRSIDALNGLAIAYTRLGRFDIAQTYFERALQVDATSALTLNNYGWSLIEQGRLRDARAFMELALDHAAEADEPVVAANIESTRRARAPALVAALEEGSPPGARSGGRIIRVAANVHRLATIAGPVAEGVAGSARASAEQFPAAEPDLDTRVDPQFGDALIEIRAGPVSNSAAAAILAGDQK
jgi:tetratricopeptide (TPR) repeat protein